MTRTLSPQQFVAGLFTGHSKQAGPNLAADMLQSGAASAGKVNNAIAGTAGAPPAPGVTPPGITQPPKLGLPGAAKPKASPGALGMGMASEGKLDQPAWPAPKVAPASALAASKPSTQFPLPPKPAPSAIPGGMLMADGIESGAAEGVRDTPLLNTSKPPAPMRATVTAPSPQFIADPMAPTTLQRAPIAAQPPEPAPETQTIGQMMDGMKTKPEIYGPRAAQRMGLDPKTPASSLGPYLNDVIKTPEARAFNPHAPRPSVAAPPSPGASQAIPPQPMRPGGSSRSLNAPLERPAAPVPASPKPGVGSATMPAAVKALRDSLPPGGQGELDQLRAQNAATNRAVDRKWNAIDQSADQQANLSMQAKGRAPRYTAMRATTPSSFGEAMASGVGGYGAGAEAQGPRTLPRGEVQQIVAKQKARDYATLNPSMASRFGTPYQKPEHLRFKSMDELVRGGAFRDREGHYAANGSYTVGRKLPPTAAQVAGQTVAAR